MRTRNFGKFKWTRRREEAAGLVAEGRLTIADVARTVGVSRPCIDEWRYRLEFAARVEEVVQAARAAIRDRGIADKSSRVAALEARWRAMHRVLEARARELADVPGGDTGLLIRRVRLTKPSGTRAGPLREIVEYVVDVKLLKEMRETEKQIAIELGQWMERQPVGDPLTRALDSILIEMEAAGEIPAICPPGPLALDAAPGPPYNCVTVATQLEEP